MERHAGTKGIFEVQHLRCRKPFRAHPVSVSEPSAVALVAIDAIRNIVEILFLIWVQVLAPLKRVDGLKGFAKCDLITYRPRINSTELEGRSSEGP